MILLLSGQAIPAAAQPHPRRVLSYVRCRTGRPRGRSGVQLSEGCAALSLPSPPPVSPPPSPLSLAPPPSPPSGPLLLSLVEDAAGVSPPPSPPSLPPAE